MCLKVLALSTQHISLIKPNFRRKCRNCAFFCSVCTACAALCSGYIPLHVYILCWWVSTYSCVVMCLHSKGCRLTVNNKQSSKQTNFINNLTGFFLSISNKNIFTLFLRSQQAYVSCYQLKTQLSLMKIFPVCRSLLLLATTKLVIQPERLFYMWERLH